MEKRLQLWSPVWGWLATKEGESVDLKGQDLVLYEAAIQEALEQEKLYYRKKSAPFNLMDYYDADDSVKEKVQNLDIQVKKEQDGLYVCASLALIEPLTQQELEARPPAGLLSGTRNGTPSGLWSARRTTPGRRWWIRSWPLECP